MFALSAWLGLAWLGPAEYSNGKVFGICRRPESPCCPVLQSAPRKQPTLAPLPSCSSRPILWCSISRRMEKLNYAWLTRKLNKFSNKFTRNRVSETASERKREREIEYCMHMRVKERESECEFVCAVYANFICQRIFHEVPCLSRCRRRRRSHCLSCCCCCWRCI